MLILKLEEFFVGAETDSFDRRNPVGPSGNRWIDCYQSILGASRTGLEEGSDNAELKKWKRGDPQCSGESPPIARHYPALQKIIKLAQRTVPRLSNDDMIEHFDFEKLPGADQVARDFDVSFARRGVAAGMVMD